MHWDVIEVKATAPLTLFVRFADGLSGKVRFSPNHLTGVFAPLVNKDFFTKAYVHDGVVTWPGEIDLAPDAMYYAIKQKGEWLLS